MPTYRPPRDDQEQPPPARPPVHRRPPEAGTEERPPQDATPDGARKPEPEEPESEWAFLAKRHARTDRNIKRGASMQRHIRCRLTFSLVSVAFAIAAVPVNAGASITLDGSFSTATVNKDFVSLCPSGVADECGTMQLAGLGTADWAYAFGPTFEPDGRCFDVDGSLTLTMQSDGSTISGPLTGLFCPRPSFTGHSHGGAVSYGNPFVEDDTVELSDGTGQFEGLSGTASFHTFDAGARFRGTLHGGLGSNA